MARTACFKTDPRVAGNVEYRGSRGHPCLAIGLSSIVHCSYLKSSLPSLNPQQHKQSSGRNSKPAMPSPLKTHLHLIPTLASFPLVIMEKVPITFPQISYCTNFQLLSLSIGSFPTSFTYVKTLHTLTTTKTTPTILLDYTTSSSKWPTSLSPFQSRLLFRLVQVSCLKFILTSHSS